MAQVERGPETTGTPAPTVANSAPGSSEPRPARQDEAPEPPVTDVVAAAAGQAASRILGTWVTVPEPEQAEPEIAF